MTKQAIYGIFAALVTAAIVIGVGYISRPHKSQGSQAQTGASQSQSGGTGNQSKTPTPNGPYPVGVYFSKHPDSDDDPGKTFAVKRLSPDLSVANYALTQLLKGPTAIESDQGYFTTARLRAGENKSDFKLSITNGIAKLQFLKPFDHLGVVADGQADSEIKATLKQFSTVKKVIVLNSLGNCEFDLSGENLCLSQ